MYPYEELMTKLANSRIHLSPAVQDVVSRVKQAGLHRVAESFYGQPITFKTAATMLGEKLVRSELKRQKIASGMGSLKHLEENGEVILPKIAAMFDLKTLKKLVPEAGEAAAKEVPEQFGPTVGRESGDLFSAFANQAGEVPMRKGLGKTTVRGEIPTVKPLEEYHLGLPKPPTG